MNKGDMVKLVAQQTDLKVPVVQEVLRTVLEITSMSLAVGDGVSFRGFGRFEPRQHPPVTLKNPKTGEPILVPERSTVVFLPSTTLKSRLNVDG